ncbi:sigma-70 family RNA polymerase sigma factor [Streptosporangium sp. NPDC051023]|uniref:RNA polymerase sigma factor n=1 Tax=Streptosporangium sp. NPDC051023 TaxID=3155410 RepID=UPI0034504E41
MPAWPTVGRTDDQRLAEALRRADAEAPSDLYDSYAERLNDYARSLLGDRDAAAEAVHDALVTAIKCADRLREQGRLRPWLYALTRARCETGPGGGRAARDRAQAPCEHDDPQERELATLVHEALAELGGQERQALELSLRHGLSEAETGLVLGLTSRQARSAVNRARDHLENAAAAVVLAKVGRAHCPDLSAMVDSWEGPLTTMLRRRLSSHIGRCEVCTERRDRHVSAVTLLDMVPVALPPLSLRRRVVETCANPEFAGTRASISSAGDRFDRTGFPVAGGRAKTRRGAADGARTRAVPKEARRARGTRGGARRAREEDHGGTTAGARRAAPARRRGASRRATPVIVAALCVLAATCAVVVITGRDVAGGHVEAAPGRRPALIPPAPGPRSGSDPEVEAEAAPGPSEPPADPPPTPTLGPGPSPSPSPGRSTRAGTAAPTPSRARPPATRRPTTEHPRVTRTPAAPAAAARLAVSCPTRIEEGSGQIRLTARNGVVSWSATTSGGLDVHPRRGRLRAGAGGVIWVTAADPGESGSGRVSFTSAGGGSSCAISWESPEPQASEPAGDPPPEPTQAPTETPESGTETT